MKRQQPELVLSWHDEDALARAIGLVPEKVYEVRRQKMPRTSYRLQSGHIAYTRAGVEELLNDLGVELPQQKKGSPDLWGRPSLEDVLARSEIGGSVHLEDDGCERFTVMGPLPDPQKLRAGRLSDGFECTVLVPNSANFLIGMEFVGRLVNEAAAVYELVGAAPRWRGRW